VFCNSDEVLANQLTVKAYDALILDDHSSYCDSFAMKIGASFSLLLSVLIAWVFAFN
jgi:hypothetical protein